MPCITLTTDFGLADWFVGVMKGVIVRLAPKAVVIDLTHGVPAGEVAAGAYALAAGCRWYPRGTVHVAVVDPGVGGPRAALVVRTANFTFVGPDNGVLSLALAGEPVRDIRRIENPAWLLRPVSNTFHGRDVFAPVAARIARGDDPAGVGPKTGEFVRLPWPKPARTGRVIRGAVVYVDRFGSAITNIPGRMLGESVSRWSARVPGRARIPIARFYQAVAAGRAVGVPGSGGFVEIAINGGSAARRLGLRPGVSVTLRRA
jgi:S-adenosylmethionine hydrolase